MICMTVLRQCIKITIVSILFLEEAGHSCLTLSRGVGCNFGVCCGGGILGNECLDIKFALAASIVHVTNLSKYLSFSPPLVMDAADAPHAPYISIGVITIKTVAIIEVEGDSQSFFGIHRGIRVLNV